MLADSYVLLYHINICLFLFLGAKQYFFSGDLTYFQDKTGWKMENMITSWVIRALN